ncbi:hypothetical protein [Sulfurovum sp.]|uniref:hypothetical protein n=1 Tax=Sulfurovum sp. TaxID=1969726 RepID=UPI0028681FDD|nr:hypothetical protein [Sulfurovum sp.]
MNYIEQEFHNDGYSSIDIWYSDDFVSSISLYDEKFIGNNDSKTYIDYLDIDGSQVSLTIERTNSSIIVVIEDENINGYFNGDFDLNNFEFILNTYEEEIEENDLIIPLYVPTLPYTNLMSSIVYDIDRTNIIPLVDVDSVERLHKYTEDEILVFKHFLDLEFIDKIVNSQEIEKAKEKRKEERKLYGAGKQITELPDKQREDLDNWEIVQQYNSINEKNLIIPVLNWCRGNEISTDINELLGFYSEIAIRVSSSFSSFAIMCDSLIANLPEHFSLSNIYIILDLSNNFVVSQYIDTVRDISQKFENTIYLGAQFGVGDISKKRDTETNMNHVSSNKPLEIFSILQKSCPNLAYGDYCGFDRKTITRAVGGRPTARVVLASTDDSMKMLVRRAWDDRDEKKDKNGNTTIGLIHSMTLLMVDIQNGKLDDVKGVPFLDMSYDVDESLCEYHPERPSPGILKTLCLRHNYLTVVNNFLKN